MLAYNLGKIDTFVNHFESPQYEGNVSAEEMLSVKLADHGGLGGGHTGPPLQEVDKRRTKDVLRT